MNTELSETYCLEVYNRSGQLMKVVPMKVAAYPSPTQIRDAFLSVDVRKLKLVPHGFSPEDCVYWMRQHLVARVAKIFTLGESVKPPAKRKWQFTAKQLSTESSSAKKPPKSDSSISYFCTEEQIEEMLVKHKGKLTPIGT